MSMKSNTSPAIRWQLLSTVSAIALAASLCSAGDAAAASSDADRPLIWIEFGGQAELTSGLGDAFAPPFLAANPDSTVFWHGVSPLQAQKLPPSSLGEEGKISFQPESSNWVFSAAIRFGRSSTNRDVDHQTKGFGYEKYIDNKPAVPVSTPVCPDVGVINVMFCTTARFSNTKAHRQESHAVLDFSAGKDVGLGMFGSQSTSVISAGVRFAQFTSNASMDIRARPEFGTKYLPSAMAPTRDKLPFFNSYHATEHASRSFHGVGPALSWTGSTPFVGNAHDGDIELDWGANVGVIFGRQKAHVRHQETAVYVPWGRCILHQCYQSLYHHPSSGHPAFGHDTDRSVTVPNVGGSLGLSFRRGDAKVSLGYRADLFVGAMDVGIDTRKSSNVLFHGPYASISVGLGG